MFKGISAGSSRSASLGLYAPYISCRRATNQVTSFGMETDQINLDSRPVLLNDMLCDIKSAWLLQKGVNGPEIA